MSNFILKKDYWSIILFTWIFIGCYFLSKELSSNNILIVLPVSGIAAVAGYLLANRVSNKSLILKLFLVFLWTVIFVGGILVIRDGQKDNFNTDYAYGQNSLEGLWETDEEEGFKLRLKINNNEALMSISPTFEEIEYELKFYESRVHFMKDGGIKFDFTKENIDDKSLTLSQSGETLVFTKLN